MNLSQHNIDVILPVVISGSSYLLTCVAMDLLKLVKKEWIIQPKHIMVGQERYDCIVYSLTNLAIGMLGLLLFRFYYLDAITLQECGSNCLFTETLKLIYLLFLADTAFYWSHRFLHIPSVYRIGHKLHHTHTSPISWTALYVHPVEFVLAFGGIFVLPTIFVRTHIVTYTLFLVLNMVSLVVSHSGLHIPYLINARHHDSHHRNFTVDFGSKFTIWDHVMGTISKKSKSKSKSMKDLKI
ncbi:hypothetical protein PPL_03289 [Heterostelium album PN500]|uniref:Fatty acid hydroxylase domain-containing protein n=1 Tax=Heterostelium pallidum (strain ATCC 26659 / Pp 5 / PN500) TaxID=670386 RepID=D3B4G4_HETP5|nr:hypothetical protein PPL_03289 [Heterostelium album PN500]EFA84212.1 hypothetical protein PPL_03289 [Heterostelium album PN500]|eukprot:XP_020436328.1 hypothetical protein PPL_03289 [Heterostelium album PN500]